MISKPKRNIYTDPGLRNEYQASQDAQRRLLKMQSDALKHEPSQEEMAAILNAAKEAEESAIARANDTQWAESDAAKASAEASSAAASVAATSETPAEREEYYRYKDNYVQDPGTVNETVQAIVTPALENPPAGLSALKSGNFLTRFGRDEHAFSTDRLANIAGYCTYLRKACSENGLFTKLKDARI
jgi:hypothetical protein